MTISYASVCDIGLKAKENQDAIFCGCSGNEGLFAVADGMGGHSDGSFASGTIRKNLQAWWERFADSTVQVDGYLHYFDSLEKVLEQSNEEIKAAMPPGTICGSTAVLLWLEDDSCGVLNCGDSRCYCICEREDGPAILQLSKDDIWENAERNVRGLTPEEIRAHRNRGKLTRAIGTERVLECHSNVNDLPEKSVFVLCSDGVYKHMPEELFREMILSAYGKNGEELNRLVLAIRKKIFEYGATDNFSLILVSVEI